MCEIQDVFNIGDVAPKALIPLSETEIIKSWYDSRPIVSILCGTYEHSKYISNAIDGMVAQRTSFPFEIIIRDDGSNDGTADIVKEYSEKYPRIIRPILEKCNNYPKEKSIFVMREKAQGKYFAYCEGDDYWIDPNKLEKQVSLLEENLNLVSVTSAQIDIEDGFIVDIKYNRGGTRTLLHKGNIDIPSHRQEFIYFGDTYIRAILNNFGDTYCISEPMAVWRKHKGGVFNSLLQKDNKLLQYKRSTTKFWIGNYFLESGEKDKGINAVCSSVDQLIDANNDINNIIRFRLLKRWLFSIICKIISIITSIYKNVSE